MCRRSTYNDSFAFRITLSFMHRIVNLTPYSTLNEKQQYTSGNSFCCLLFLLVKPFMKLSGITRVGDAGNQLLGLNTSKAVF